jgi:GAF domain-containing protein
MRQADSRVALVKVINEKEKLLIPISSNKPAIPDSVQEKWQKIVDLVAKIMSVPTGLITRLTEKNLEIFIASQTNGNPYSKDDKDSLGIGMFCETVAGKKKPMLVQDTEPIEFWRTNPHAGFGMHAYMGVPIVWKDGELFGTFCMLNDKTNTFTPEFLDLMLQFKDIIETDLQYALVNEELEEKLTKTELLIREVHHRTKNHFNLLISFINLQSGKNAAKLDEILSNIQNRVHAISMVHEQLYSKKNNDQIRLREYITRLCEIILNNLSGSKVTSEFDIDD